MAGHGGHGGANARKVVMAALAGNAGIAVAKLVAAALSGSLSMAAEAVHSIADTMNQALLLVGMNLADKRDPERYPMGRSTELYFWPFMVALLLFFLGGAFAIYEGAEKLFHLLAPAAGHTPHAEPAAATGWLGYVPLGVLAVSILMEGGSFLVAFREFNKERGGKPVAQALFDGKDPVIPVVLLEDAGAMAGLLIAFASIGIGSLTGSQIPDAVGSVLIGILLCVIAYFLARDTRSLLIGEAAAPEKVARVRELGVTVEGIERLTQVLSLHLGPNTVMLALKVRFRPKMTLEELEQRIDQLEAAIRAELPEMKRIFVEPDSDYDEAHDPELGAG